MIRTVKDLLNELKDKDPEMPIAEALSLSVKMDIHDIYQRECDEEGCRGYLIQKGYEAATKDTDFMDVFVGHYRHKFDSEYGTWDNIEGAMSYFQEELDGFAPNHGEGKDSDDCM